MRRVKGTPEGTAARRDAALRPSMLREIQHQGSEDDHRTGERHESGWQADPCKLKNRVVDLREQLQEKKETPDLSCRRNPQTRLANEFWLRRGVVRCVCGERVIRDLLRWERKG